MAQAVVLQNVTTGPVSALTAQPALTRQEAHLRLVRASWAAANGLSDLTGRTTPVPGVSGSTAVWSSGQQRGLSFSAGAEKGPGALPAAGARAADTSLTLTRRGRFLLIGLPIALGVIALILLGAFLTSRAQAGESTPVSTTTLEVSVIPGDTLWDIAVRHSPERDPRAVVAEVVELNDLHTSLVQAGQRLLIPVGR